MKINGNHNFSNHTFVNIDCGEVFEYEGDIMMKIETVDAGEEIVNAVFIDNGTVTFVDDCAFVFPLKGSLSIE